MTTRIAPSAVLEVAIEELVAEGLGDGERLAEIVMLHSAAFGKVTAYVGIVFGIASLVPPLGIIGMVFAFASLLPMLAWLILIARRLFRLNRGVEPANGVRATGSRRVAT